MIFSTPLSNVTVNSSFGWYTAIPVSTPSIIQFPFVPTTISGVWPSSPLSPFSPFLITNDVVVPFVNVIVYVSIRPSESVFLIDEIPLPVSPLIFEGFKVSTPSITQFPFSPIVIIGVWPSLPFIPWIPWIPWEPVEPLVTVNVVVVPFV